MAINAVGEYSREGKEIVTGSVALDGSNPTAVTTGFATIDHVSATIVSSTAPGDNTELVTYAVSGNVVNFYGWKNTGGTDPTLVASDGTETISYMIVGRRRQ